MSKALPGGHYCAEHQGNHSHYDPKNCMMCQLQNKYRRALNRITDLEVSLGESLKKAETTKSCNHQWRHDVQQITNKPNTCLLCGIEKDKFCERREEDHGKMRYTEEDALYGDGYGGD